MPIPEPPLDAPPGIRPPCRRPAGRSLRLAMPDVAPDGRRRRLRRADARRRLPPMPRSDAAAARRRSRSGMRLPRGRRGIAALLLVIAGVGVAMTFGASAAIGWTETADFCGRCHQMGPELAAYAAGPHSEVACAECHVEPGIDGLDQGQDQRHQAALPGDHGPLPEARAAARPLDPAGRGRHVPPLPLDRPARDDGHPDHHGLRRGRDEHPRVHRPDDPARAAATGPTSTRASTGTCSRTSSSWPPMTTARRSTTSRSRSPNGAGRGVLSQDQIRDTDERRRPTSQRVLTERPLRRMDCLECHNRVGHPIPNPAQGDRRRHSPRAPSIQRCPS